MFQLPDPVTDFGAKRGTRPGVIAARAGPNGTQLGRPLQARLALSGHTSARACRALGALRVLRRSRDRRRAERAVGSTRWPLGGQPRRRQRRRGRLAARARLPTLGARGRVYDGAVRVRDVRSDRVPAFRMGARAFHRAYGGRDPRRARLRAHDLSRRIRASAASRSGPTFAGGAGRCARLGAHRRTGRRSGSESRQRTFPASASSAALGAGAPRRGLGRPADASNDG